MLGKFAVFILTHNRPDNIFTIKSLKKAGYTGEYYLIIDDKDPQREEYKKLYGDKVIEFSKEEIGKTFDIGDNFLEKSSPVYARNACFDIAKDLGLDYFLQLDDDYLRFEHRWGNQGKLDFCYVKELDRIFALMIEYLENTGALTVAFSQTGDFVGGVEGAFKKRLLRKAMNSFFCKTDRRFNFIGKVNDDVNTYVTLAKTGGIFLTITDISILQQATQKQEGGVTDLYLKYGTYVKSFYTIIMNPSCVKVNKMGNIDRRIHHLVQWDKCAPKIISEEYKKERV